MKSAWLLLVLVSQVSCQPRPASDTAARSDSSAEVRPAAPADSTPPATSVDSTPAAEQLPVSRPTINPRPPDSPVSIAQILGSSAWNGTTVTVSGVCLGYRVPPVAVGSPPRTRSDWQLEAGGKAIYVTGPLPSGCSATEGSSTAMTISALVQEDTLRALGNNPAQSRRYLEWRGPGSLPAPRQ